MIIMENDKKSRSPRYPSINLNDAIEKVRLIYQKEHTHKASREVIARDLGYSGISGASATVIASIKQFGLLESVGDGLRVSEDATIVLELPVGDPERNRVLEKLAYAPSLFSELYREFGNRLPSDENLRLYLVRAGFNSNAANSAIRSFRETTDSVGEQAGQQIESEGLVTSETDFATTSSHAIVRPPRNYVMKAEGGVFRVSPQESVSEELQFRLADDCKVRVRFTGAVTREAVEKLIAYLELGVDDFPSKLLTLRPQQTDVANDKMEDESVTA